jgi:transposase
LKKHYQRHDIQFKRQAVKLASHPALRTQDVAAALGIHPFMLWRWKKELRDGKVLMDKPGRKLRAATVEEADDGIRELERENAQLREENDLLKSSDPSAHLECGSLRLHRGTRGAVQSDLAVPIHEGVDQRLLRLARPGAEHSRAEGP